MKRLMILGGSRYAIPVIEAAHELGCYVITCDYLPGNIAHQYSDAYCNISIIEKEDVLKSAENLKIDGIMSFACDPGVITAAYVSEKMGLPSVGSYESVSILQNKGRFREFMAENGFNVPMAKSYYCIKDAIRDSDQFNWPVIVKPTDSAGSKGVKRVNDPSDLKKCIEHALSYSRNKEFIIEDYLEQVGYSSDTDSFSVDGKLKYVSFNCQYFDKNAKNPYTPAAYSWPSTISNHHQLELAKEIQRLITLLDLKSSIYNIETRECVNGKAYIMECSPRGGGNRLAEMLRYSTGVDLITNSVKAALGEPCIKVEQKPYNGYWAEIVLHSDNPGEFSDLWLSNEIKDCIVERDLWINKGDIIGGFSAANEAIGTLILQFKTQDKMKEVLRSQDNFVKVIVK